ncbi:MAG TPA: hypothetical protein VN253_28805, partial [Kofleriaceae bacterium]|nr:hypothetical protein [Kofleriaceae bacterium]
LAAPPPPTAPPRVVEAAAETQPIADEIQLLFRAGGATYMRLADLERDADGARRWPAHATPRLLNEQGVHVALAAVRNADVPAPHRAWAGRQVVVDGTCRATVAGFAIASRLVGSPSYAGMEKEEWDVASVMHAGTPVLAARLDGCAGTYARDAALPPVVIPEPVHDERLARQARSALIASAAGAETAQKWKEMSDQVPPGAWWEHTELTTNVVRHPRTGATFVAVHGYIEYVCGGPDVNVWGLYRAAADGTLTPVRETRLESLHSIEQIIDIEGDGELELIGRPWLGLDVVVADAGGGVLDQLGMQFYGCPC